MTGTDLEHHLERYLELRRALGFEMRWKAGCFVTSWRSLPGEQWQNHTSLRRRSSGHPHAADKTGSPSV